MKVSNMTRVFVVLILFVIAVSLTNTHVEARPAPSFGQRRLLNLSGNSVEPTEVPESLLVASGNKLHMVLRADGVQEYVFQDGKWSLFNASATLFSFAGQEIGKHYFLSFGGHPTWQTLSPESVITGAPSVKVTVQEDAIPWLLLKATDWSGSSDEFGEVTFVQRLYTENGLAPDPSSSAKAGDIFKSSYKAVYFFYKNG